MAESTSVFLVDSVSSRREQSQQTGNTPTQLPSQDRSMNEREKSLSTSDMATCLHGYVRLKWFDHPPDISQLVDVDRREHDASCGMLHSFSRIKAWRHP